MASSSPALKPHWLVQAGAWQFKHARFADAVSHFQEVVDQHPQHPRAEVARLMIARARIEEWRTEYRARKSRGEEPPRELWEKYHTAHAALDDYVKAHPRGRFVADIPGWRGGLARETGAIPGAIEYFLEQLDTPDHFEITRGAVRELDRCLEELDPAEHASALPVNAIAKRPIAALAVVYHFLDPKSREDFGAIVERLERSDREELDPRVTLPLLHMRRAGREVLPRLAEAVARQEARYSKAWRPQYLAILAWAASESGQHGQAVRLCELADEAGKQSEDLLFVHAVALQRSERLGEAIALFRRLRALAPRGPIASEARFRIATALRDQKEAGLAVVELLRWLDELARAKRALSEQQQPEAASKTEWDTSRPEPEQPRPESLHPESESRQWLDTLLQFAPMDELARGLSSPDLEPAIAARLRAVLRARHLAVGEFEAALRFADQAVVEAPNGAPFVPRVVFPDADEGHWTASVRELQALTQKAESPLTTAELASKWEKARGRLTMPSLQDFWLFGTDYSPSWEQRHRHAQVAGLSAADAAAELEARDELLHAFRLWQRAADHAPATPLAAECLAHANDALRRMAELSPWSLARAFETDASARSRELHARLVRDHPGSEEAKQSVWWTFPPPAEVQWLPGDWPPYNVEVAIADAFTGYRGNAHDSPQWADFRAFEKRLGELLAPARESEPHAVLEQVRQFRRDFLPHFTSARGAFIINALDDLELFLTTPGLTPSVCAKYFAARRSDAPPPINDPEMQPWRDFLTFLALVREPGFEDPVTGERRGRPMEERMREFLDKFPHSAKREAALTRLAIATVRSMRRVRVVHSTWPQSPTPDGYKALVVERREPFDARRAFAALDACDREFPHGRYSADIRLWRGAAFAEAGDWPRAIDLLVATLDDQSKRDLHLDAALHLAEIFMRLLEAPPDRAAITPAIKANPSAQRRLHEFMHSATMGARLRLLESWLAEQFAN